MTSDKGVSSDRSGEGFGGDTWRDDSAVARTKTWNKIARLEVPQSFFIYLPLVSRKDQIISLFVPGIDFCQDSGRLVHYFVSELS